ncbi:hypothetical protein HYX19_04595 [Candidatus Woesearchaeota archaeon]|nr:hypothetical protein [Candidatus Woesearchaeota archaeon]
MKKEEIKEILQKELSSNKENRIYLLVTDTEDYHYSILSLLEYFTDKLKLEGIYITFNRPYSTIVNKLKGDKIDTSKICFIDCTGKKESNENCFFIDGPQSLTELSILITSITDSKNVGFLLFDSLSALLVYNKKDIVERFTHYLMNKARLFNTLSFFIILKEDEASNKITPNISLFCDKIIKI